MKRGGRQLTSVPNRAIAIATPIQFNAKYRTILMSDDLAEPPKRWIFIYSANHKKTTNGFPKRPTSYKKNGTIARLMNDAR